MFAFQDSVNTLFYFHFFPETLLSGLFLPQSTQEEALDSRRLLVPHPSIQDKNATSDTNAIFYTSNSLTHKKICSCIKRGRESFLTVAALKVY